MREGVPGGTERMPSTQDTPQAAVTKNEADLIVLTQKYLHDKNCIMFETYLFLNFNINIELYNLLCEGS